MRARVEPSAAERRSDPVSTQARAFEMLCQTGAVSRSSLRRSLGVSISTITSAVQELVARGLVVEAGRESSSGGRPPVLLDLAPSLGGVLALDVGGISVRVASATCAGSIVFRRTLATAAAAEDGGLGRAIGDALVEARGHLAGPVLAVGAAIAGIVHPQTGAISHVDNVPGWDDRWLDGLGSPLLVDNEANLGALGERALGAARGVDDVLFVALGAGLGAGLILDGRLYRGAAGAAGEMGLFGRGLRGADPLEGGVAAGGIVAAFRAHGGGEAVDAGAVLDRAEAGEAEAVAALADVLDELAGAVANAVLVINPEVVVLGGGLAAARPRLRQEFDDRLRPLVPNPPRVVTGQLGGDAAVVGAVNWAADAARRSIVAELSAR